MKSEDGERVACSRAASGSGAEAGNLNCIFHLCFWTLFQAGFYFFVGFLLIIVISDVELIGHMTEKWKKITKSQKPSTCTSRSRNSVFYRNTFKDRLIGDTCDVPAKESLSWSMFVHVKVTLNPGGLYSYER